MIGFWSSFLMVTGRIDVDCVGVVGRFCDDVDDPEVDDLDGITSGRWNLKKML
jgi:hypothetical protein